MAYCIICTYIWSHRPPVSFQKTFMSQCSPHRVPAGGPTSGPAGGTCTLGHSNNSPKTNTLLCSKA